AKPGHLWSSGPANAIQAIASSPHRSRPSGLCAESCWGLPRLGQEDGAAAPRATLSNGWFASASLRTIRRSAWGDTEQLRAAGQETDEVIGDASAFASTILSARGRGDRGVSTRRTAG